MAKLKANKALNLKMLESKDKNLKVLECKDKELKVLECKDMELEMQESKVPINSKQDKLKNQSFEIPQICVFTSINFNL